MPSKTIASMPSGSKSSAETAILVLEDDDAFRELLKKLLSRAGYQVIGCASAVDALTELQRGTPVSLIVLDLMMPGLTGFQFRTEQRADPALRDIPVVVLTGGDRSHEYHGNLGALAYLQKPVDLETLLSVVRECCGPPAMAIKPT